MDGYCVQATNSICSHEGSKTCMNSYLESTSKVAVASAVFGLSLSSQGFGDLAGYELAI
jgi:hypothetical protein